MSVPAPSVPAPSVPAPSVPAPSVPAPSVPAPDPRPFGRIPSWLLWTLLALLSGVGAAGARAAAAGELMRFAAAGEAMVRGDLGSVYADPWMQAGPFEILGSLAMLPLPFEHHNSFLEDSGFGAMIPVCLVGGTLIVAVLGFTLRWARRVGGLPPAPVLVFLTVALGFVLRLPWRTFEGGHLAQVAVPFCWLWAAHAATRGRVAPAGLMVGLSAGWEPWGVLAAPVLLLDPATDLRHWRPVTGTAARLLRGGFALAVGAVLPYVPFAATGRFTLFDHQWFALRGSLVGLWLGETEPVGWGLRLGQGGLALLAGGAVALALRGRRESLWAVPTAVQLVRLLLDPLALDYYWFPLLVLALVALAMLAPTPPRGQVVTTAALVLAPQLQALSPGLRAPSLFAVAGLVMAAALLVLCVVRIRQGPPPPAAAVSRLGRGRPRLPALLRDPAQP
jgi:hypothetical protein